MPPYTPDLAAAPWVYWNAVDGDLVLFDTRSGSYHALNASASQIWRLIAERGELAAVADELAALFPDDMPNIATELQSFVAEALRLGLLVKP